MFSIIVLIQYYTASWVGSGSAVRVSASYSIAPTYLHVPPKSEIPSTKLGPYCKVPAVDQVIYLVIYLVQPHWQVSNQ